MQRWSAVALASEVSRLRDAAAAYATAAGATEDVVADVKLAVSEALTNVVVHAYDGDRPGDMRLSAHVREQELIVTVGDDGRGLIPRADSPGLGLGLPLMASFADRLDVRSRGDDGGTCVTMAFALAKRAREG